MRLTNAQYDEIMREYSYKQDLARHEIEERTSEIMKCLPEYKNLSDSVGMLSVEAAKANMRGDASAIANLSTKLSSIRLRMKDILMEAGYPEDYLTVRYSCPDCHDTGYINNVKCHCFKQAAINLLYNQSNLQANIADTGFDKFNLDYYPINQIDAGTGVSARENAQEVLDSCRKFVDNFGGGKNILFYGNTGVGKTFLSNCIAKELLNSEHSVLYLSATEFFDRIATYNSDDYEDSESQVLQCDLLIIDDLGTEVANTLTNSRLFMCINDRLNNNRSTIISTNYSIKELQAAYSDRIFSRISSSYEILKLYGDDIRMN